MSEGIEKLNNQIEVDKEILSVLPKNNKKNLQAYKDKAGEIEQEYNTFLNNLRSEIKRRFLKIDSISPNPQISELSEQIDKMSDISYLNTDVTPFEKMELDEILYVLKRFYKNNLDIVNESILKCIEKFKIAGIKLELKDFNYSIYVKDYMEVFLNEMKIGELNSIKIKNTFEEIYWKCPEIILHIELNIRCLYLKYEKKISSYFANKQKETLNSYDLSSQEIIQKYNMLKNKLNDLMNRDTALIIDMFKNSQRNAKDYETSTIRKHYTKLIGKSPEELEQNILDEYNTNIEKMASSLNEYDKYNKYKYIYDGIIEIYNSKEKYKKLYNDNLKQIKKLQNKLFKQNKRIEKYSNHHGLIAKLFDRGPKKLEAINIEINNQVLELKKAYRSLEDNKTNSIICEKLNNTSTIYDALSLGASFYSFIVNTIIKNNEDIQQEEIIKIVNDFKEFVALPNMTIINNITLLNEKDIVLVIKDKYNLCNINLEKTDFTEDNIQGLITSVNNICNYNYIKNSRISLEDIKFLLEANKVLDVNE